MTNTNFFDLFQLPQRFDLSAEQLKNIDKTYQQIQKEVHPDRFVNESENAKLSALQKSATANEAVKTLKNKLLRAKYLLQINGFDLNDENTRSATVMSPEFLMEQLDWREAVNDAYNDKNTEKLEQNLQKLQQQQKLHFQKIGEFFAANDFENARNEVIRLMFLDKLEREIIEFLDILSF